MDKNNRKTQYDIIYLKMAETFGTLSYCKRKQVGCLIVKDNNILSSGFNGTPMGANNCCEDTNNKTKWDVLHAEANAILKLTKSTQTCENATLYINLSPCKECSKLILQSGITRVVYNREHSCQEGIEFLKSFNIECQYIDTNN